ncbi:ATP/GTP-binding protein [Candidatus Thiodubiliella endoseptemdiera]|uniref:AAA family ATPase n=1 Tax=Candidatus Thiodubiliella endoseptemdiera TaxID=2738886 RepID=UPI0034DEF3C8
MNYFKIEIDHLQSIKHLEFELEVKDLNSGKLMCIVGKNGVGKTTFIKSIANLLRADIFKETSSPYIFNKNSKITYHIDSDCYTHTYNEKFKTIDSKNVVADTIKNKIIGELPLPHGERFKFFQAISDLDKEIRQKYIAEDYKTPEKLITWYKNIYTSDKFDELKEVTINKKQYYFLPQEDNRYIREDYFSSGEYFILSIYRLIQQQKKLIVIDELDISLDASAQVHLLKELRDFCQTQSVTLIFTTHSLAIMKMLKDDELFYLENTNGQCEITEQSYNYIKGILYQFKGWDKYILTEDKVLLNFIEWQLQLESNKLRKKHITIPIGPVSSVIALMDKNGSEGFFSAENNVISVIDGDHKQHYESKPKVLFLPFDSVEKKLSELYNNDKKNVFFEDVIIPENDSKGRAIFNRMKKIHSQNEIFQFVTNSNSLGVTEFRQALQEFINQ